MKRRLALMPCLVALVGSAAGCATANPAIASPRPKESQEEAARRLLRLTGSDKLALQVMQTMIESFRKSFPDVPNKFWNDFASRVKGEDLIELTVPIYVKHFSTQEMEDAITFYESPSGRKIIAETPAAVKESMSVGGQWGKMLARQAIEELRVAGYVKREL